MKWLSLEKGKKGLVNIFLFLNFLLHFGFGVHVKSMQDCCIGTHVAVWFAAFLPITYIWYFSPCCLSPTPQPPAAPLFPPDRPQYVMLPSRVHVFPLFNTHLWVRTCSVWFSVLVSVYWEWWFSDSSMSLQRTWTHPFYGCIVFHSVFVPHFLCPVYLWWAFGLIPYICYCELSSANTGTENQAKHVLTYKWELNNENIWTQGGNNTHWGQLGVRGGWDGETIRTNS